MFRRTADEQEVSELEVTPYPNDLGVDARESDVSVVAKGARLEGKVAISGSLQVEGQIKGEIKADGDVELLPQGVVEGDIEGQNVRVAGILTGHVVAKNKAHVSPGGRVEGDITSNALIIEEGAYFIGSSIMGEKVPEDESTARPLPRGRHEAIGNLDEPG
jgi:cytoskeletal protein CcmA (bactofilin family)